MQSLPSPNVSLRSAPLSAPTPAVAPPDEITVVTYNVESMFLTPDPGKTAADQPVKSTEALRALAHSIKSTQGDVVALQEVHNTDDLKRFLTENNLADVYPYLYVSPGNDHRNINNAVISRFPFKTIQTHQADRFPVQGQAEPQQFSRDLLEVTVGVTPSFDLTMMVAHLKAHSHPTTEAEEVRRDAIRLAEVQQIKRIIAAETRAYPHKKYIVMGDMNDTPQTAAVHALIAGSEGSPPLLDPMAGSSELTETSYNRRIDYMLLSPTLVPHYVAGSAHAVVDPETSIASDHRPVVARFRVSDENVAYRDGNKVSPDYDVTPRGQLTAPQEAR